MKKIWKKTAAVILSASMVLGLRACGSKTAEPADSATVSKDILNEVGTYPIVKEPITLTMMIMSKSWIKDYNTNDFTK